MIRIRRHRPLTKTIKYPCSCRGAGVNGGLLTKDTEQSFLPILMPTEKVVSQSTTTISRVQFGVDVDVNGFTATASSKFWFEQENSDISFNQDETPDSGTAVGNYLNRAIAYGNIHSGDVDTVCVQRKDGNFQVSGRKRGSVCCVGWHVAVFAAICVIIKEYAHNETLHPRSELSSPQLSVFDQCTKSSHYCL